MLILWSVSWWGVGVAEGIAPNEDTSAAATELERTQGIESAALEAQVERAEQHGATTSLLWSTYAVVLPLPSFVLDLAG